MGYKMKGSSFYGKGFTCNADSKRSPMKKKDGDTASREVTDAENPDTYVEKGKKNLGDTDNLTLKIATMAARASNIQNDISDGVFEGSDLDRAKNRMSAIKDDISKLKALKNTKDFV